ncbi:hypothetical protein F2Q69_00063529, partial [Brassica cretica]
FQERQLIRRRQSRGPDALFVTTYYFADDGLDTDARRFVFGSSLAYTARFPTLGSSVCHGTCDGLVCLYSVFDPRVNVVVNPATRWDQTFPLSTIQRFINDMSENGVFFTPPKLGFGKDKLTGTYKAVYLYNSSLYGLDDVTTCEVFDFSAKAWRQVHPASPYREDTKVLSFDLHTESFQVICTAPFAHVPDDLYSVTICILDNRLCVSKKNWPTQEIWSFDSSSGAWTIMCSIDLTKTFSWFGEPKFVLSPVAILNKNKLLLQGRDYFDALVIHDLDTKSYDFLFKPSTSPVGSVYYFESLFSVLSD